MVLGPMPYYTNIRTNPNKSVMPILYIGLHQTCYSILILPDLMKVELGQLLLVVVTSLVAGSVH